MKLATALLSLLLVGSIPGTTHAAARVPAGFAPGPVWISQNAPIEGIIIRVNTVVYDGGTDALEGTVSFLIDGTSIGSTTFALNAGESSIKSVAWTATPGTHTVSAEITSVHDSATKAVTSIANATTTTLSIHVTPLPPPPPVAVIASTTPENVTTSSVTLVQDLIAKTGAVTESIRTSGESYLSKLAAASAATSTPDRTGSVLGAETYATDTEATPSPTPSTMSKIAKTLLPLFAYPALFYPVLVFLILFALWLIAKRLRNPSRGK